MSLPATEPSLTESLPRILALYEEGQCLAAWEIAQRYGPFVDWPGIEPRLLASRLATHLGARRLASLLQLRTFRAHRDHSGAQYYYLYRVHERRGALAAWLERQRLGKPPDGDRDALADYHGQCAQLLGALRDFENAELHLARSFEADSSRPYWYVERSGLYELQDRYDDALRAAQDGLAISRRYPPLITSTASCLQLVGRSEEALDLLRSAAADTQSSHIVWYLIRLLIRFRLLDEIPDALSRFEELTPRREKELQDWLTSTRADVATHRGDYAAAMAYVEQVDHPYHKSIAEHLRIFLADPERRAPRRTELPVPFVRQHHMTCAPATLSAISRFWNRPAEHLSVAEEICYDGITDHSERNWANSNGWKTREFRVDWPAARALIDRGIPFTLTTSDVAAGHLQAAIGYDEPTGVLLVRDPMLHDTMEMNALELLKQQASFGPRGMAIVPADQAQLLDGISLPDAELYDLYHDMQLSLERHDRAQAVEWHRRMIAKDPEHRLTHTARRALAAYDDNIHEALAAIDALLALYPNDQRLQIDRLACMRQTATRAERLAWLETACDHPESDALLWIELATELKADDRRVQDALYYVRRALRRRPDNAQAAGLLADLHWQLGRQTEATELYRFAACLDPTREDFSKAYFVACRWLKQTEVGLAFLRARVERVGRQSAQPAMSLIGALEALNRADEAFAVLDAAVQRHPDDGELRLFAATKNAEYGRPEDARTHLDAARGRVRHAAWLAEAAREARLRADREEALRHWREILHAKPLDLEAHRMTALLLSETSTREDAIEHLRSYCAKFPHHAGLHQLLYEWSSTDPAATRELVLRKMIEIDPADAWAVRELALNLNHQSRFAEALDAANEALALEPINPSGPGVKAFVLRTSGRVAEAAACYRAAIIRSAAASDAIHGLLDVCGETVADRKEALSFLQSQLEAQPLVGEGVLAFRSAARGVLTPDELLAALRRVHEQRPDLWHAWSALVRHLSEMGQSDEALTIARGAAERFSKVPSVWFDVSLVHRARLEPEDEVAALERCRELSPEWIEPILCLGDALERCGRPEETRQLFEASIKRAPLAPEFRVRLAELLHRAGDVDRAIETVRDALRVNPESDWAWQMLMDWSAARAKSDETLTFARTFAESRPREIHAWMRLADLTLRAKRPEDALAAIDRAIAVNPQYVSAHDFRAIVLAELRRFRDAEEACDPPALRDRAPIVLQGRAAWVDAQRGDVSGAIARMRALVERMPDYRWGWSQLVEWHASQGQLEQAAEAAARWAWLSPTNVVPLGWLADLKKRSGDRAGAKEVFQRAMRLEPTYLFAGFQYFALQKEDKDYEGAARTLEILRPYVSAEELLAARIELDVAQADLDSTLERIRELCRNRDFDGAALTHAIDGAARADWQEALERALEDVLDEPTWNDATPLLWARVRIRRGRFGSWKRYRWLAAAGDPGKSAIYELLGALGERANKTAGRTAYGWYLDWHIGLIAYFCRAWRNDDVLWGKMSFALLCRERTRVVIRWMRDWRTRAGVESWMLQNLTLALLARHRDAEALAVLRHVIASFSAKVDIGYRLKLWGALGACLDGDLAVAERVLHETPADVVPAADRPVRDLALTFIEVLRAPPGRALSEQQRKVVDAVGQSPGHAARVRLVALTRYRIARHVGDRWAQLRAWR